MTIEKIDHKAEANDALAIVSAFELPQDEGYLKREVLAQAQVHATLYAAEQQRIANMIAFAGLSWAHEGTEAFTDLDDFIGLRHSISEALGLG